MKMSLQASELQVKCFALRQVKNQNTGRKALEKTATTHKLLYHRNDKELSPCTESKISPKVPIVKQASSLTEHSRDTRLMAFQDFKNITTSHWLKAMKVRQKVFTTYIHRWEATNPKKKKSSGVKEMFFCFVFLN